MSKVYIPKDLDDCFVELNKIIPTKDIEIFKDTVKEDLSCYHHGFGTSLRNKWGLWKGSCLSKWFKDQGIRHPDDMSGIIMKSYWRYLKKKPIDLDAQIEYYKNYWENIKK